MSEETQEIEEADEDIIPTSSPKEKKSEKGSSKEEEESDFERYFSR